MTSPRVEPPEELRDRDWHSQNLIERLDAAAEGAKLRRWPEHVTLLRTTASHIAALRAERDAAVARAEALQPGSEQFDRCVNAALNAIWEKITDNGAKWALGKDSWFANCRPYMNAALPAAALAAYRAASPEAKP